MSEQEQLTPAGRIIPVDIDSEMRKSFLDYAMSVIVARALPDVRDGLKPVHRRIIYTMYENNLTPDKAYRKCADTVGSVLGRYHPHGDASVYDAMVRLAQDFSMRVPLVDGHGNFGSVDGDPPAAYRYTESRMSRMALQMLPDIDKETVDFIPNYDDRLQEPSVLPARFPNLLVNGSMGIAVGMATNIPPHNLAETIDACCALLENPELELYGLMEYIQGPDFPTGGIIMGKSGIRAAYATGRGRITVRARAEIEPMHNDRERIVVTELPYGVNKATLVKYIADLVHDKRLEHISDLRDESDKDGLRIVIELKRDANAQLVLNRLYSYTELQTVFSVNMLALCEGVPKVLSLKEALEQYLLFLREVVVRRTKYELKKATERLHILEGLHLVCDNTDEVIHIIRHSKDQPDARANLSSRFGITELQSAAIVAMRLGQLSGMERIKIEEELAQIQARVRELTEFLADEGKIRQTMIQELRAVGNRYGDPRRTEIMSVSGEVDVEDLIPRQDCIVTLTQYGYIKRMPVDAYQRQHRGGRGRSAMTQREEDFVTELFVTGSHDYILLFTTAGRVFRLKSYELPEGSAQSKGSNIVNLLALEPGEKVSSMQKLSDLAQDGYFVLITKAGIIKRMEIGELKNVRKGGLRALSLDEGDALAGVRVTGGDDELVAATALGLAIRFNEGDVRAMGRQARGVKAITLSQGDSVVDLALVSEGDWLLTVSAEGRGRRTEIGQYRLQSRGGKGVINYDTGKNGAVAGVKMVREDDDVILIADDGVLIRIPVAQIAVQSRYGGGVRVMRPDEGSRVVTLARTPREQEADEEAGDALSEQEATAPDSPDADAFEPAAPDAEAPDDVDVTTDGEAKDVTTDDGDDER